MFLDDVSAAPSFKAPVRHASSREPNNKKTEAEMEVFMMLNDQFLSHMLRNDRWSI